MALGLVGKKLGMTRLFTEQGKSRAVTVVEAAPNRITQIKTVPTDGYDAVQVTIGERRDSRVNSAMKGHFAKAGVKPGRGVWEFRIPEPLEKVELQSVGKPSDGDTAADADNGEADADNVAQSDSGFIELKPGEELTVAIFNQGQAVDVVGRTIGKGFAGVMKRYGFRGGRATHGNSKAHRLGGSIGNAQDPGRVFKGKKMAGHMGAVRRVQQGLEVLRVDLERNLLLLGGSIPGSRGDDVIIQPSAKNKVIRQPMPQQSAPAKSAKAEAKAAKAASAKPDSAKAEGSADSNSSEKPQADAQAKPSDDAAKAAQPEQQTKTESGSE